MKNTIKFAALGACALAASSTAALAGSELPAGITTGLALGAPLPVGVYDISIASYGSRGGNANLASGSNPNALGNLAYAVPVWLIWSTPWTIAGGRIQFSTATGVADTWQSGAVGVDSFLNTLIDVGLKWNLGGGWNFGLQAGAWLASDQLLSATLGRNYTAFQGLASLSYLKNGWNLTATGIYGTGGGHETGGIVANGVYNEQGDWFNLDLTATRKMGKMEIGSIAYGSWDLSNSTHAQLTGACQAVTPTGHCKQSQFAVGSLVGYDFGSFVAQAKLATDVTEEHYNGRETRGWLTVIKPLWNPQSDGPLK
jgi:hypothetical protein